MSEAKEYLELITEFTKQYNDSILPVVTKYENDRVKKLKQANILRIILLLTTVVLVVLAKVFSDIAPFFLFFSFICFVSIFGVKNYIKKGFENELKQIIMPVVCKCFGNFRWRNSSYGGSRFFVESGVIPHYDLADYDDVFEGVYKDVPIDIVESHFQQKYRDSKGHTRYTTVFKGVILKIACNKNFNGHTLIKRDSLIKSSMLFSDLKHTELEDVQFEKKYDVYTNDEVEARYLITSAFMERFNNICEVFKADNVSCAFYKNEIIFALSKNKDLFSLFSLDKPLSDNEQFKEFFSEIYSIIKLINHFKLNEKIGM